MVSLPEAVDTMPFANLVSQTHEVYGISAIKTPHKGLIGANGAVDYMGNKKCNM